VELKLLSLSWASWWRLFQLEPQTLLADLPAVRPVQYLVWGDLLPLVLQLVVSSNVNCGECACGLHWHSQKRQQSPP
jgi:hypothetical protein